MTPRRLLALSVPLLLSTSLFANVSLDARTGEFGLYDPETGRMMGGKLDGPVSNVRRRDGKDAFGNFNEISFNWRGHRAAMVGYEDGTVYRFRLEYGADEAKPIRFPEFTHFPANLKAFSYQDTTFAPGAFKLAQTSTPWLFFDSKFRTILFSPASQFMVAKMVGDGKTSMGVSLNDRLIGVPKGLRQDSVLVFGEGIGATWDTWGELMRGLYKRPAATPESDVIVKSYGYWTDNGADYYYNYDPAKGYTGTLLAVRDLYRQRGLPMGYLQLDSWWYRKLSDSISGEPHPELKNRKLPAQDWNRYGGVLEYKASPDLFPDGLAAFSKEFGRPFAVHGRWIDTNSPLRSVYKISGVGPVDPKYWTDTATYLKASGVTCYEQDWLDHIYDRSPEMASTVGVADAFIDGMADAMRQNGITMQYCMATPRFILQGVKYPHLTTVRTSPDRFEPGKWAQFILGAPFVESIGAYPWCDVFRSRERGNMTLAVLSAGPVGTGDAIGAEDDSNIRSATRYDGVIVKPDRPLVPIDETYMNEALKNGKPFIGATFTEHGDYRANYIFAFPRAKDSRSFHFRSFDYRITRRSVLYNFATREIRYFDSGDEMDLPLSPEGYGYYMTVPVSKTGVALLGDVSKIVPTGKQRIESIQDRADGLRVRVRFGKIEQTAILTGYSAAKPKVKAFRGHVTLASYDPVRGKFVIGVVTSSDGTVELRIDGD